MQPDHQGQSQILWKRLDERAFRDGAKLPSIRIGGLMVEAEMLRATAPALPEPLHLRWGSKGLADALSAICGGASIISASEIPAAKAHRPAALSGISSEIGVLGMDAVQKS